MLKPKKGQARSIMLSTSTQQQSQISMMMTLTDRKSSPIFSVVKKSLPLQRSQKKPEFRRNKLVVLSPHSLLSSSVLSEKRNQNED
jgi:hypothetical protein